MSNIIWVAKMRKKFLLLQIAEMATRVAFVCTNIKDAQALESAVLQRFGMKPEVIAVNMRLVRRCANDKFEISIYDCGRDFEIPSYISAEWVIFVGTCSASPKLASVGDVVIGIESYKMSSTLDNLDTVEYAQVPSQIRQYVKNLIQNKKASKLPDTVTIRCNGIGSLPFTIACMNEKRWENSACEVLDRHTFTFGKICELHGVSNYVSIQGVKNYGDGVNDSNVSKHARNMAATTACELLYRLTIADNISASQFKEFIESRMSPESFAMVSGLLSEFQTKQN